MKNILLTVSYDGSNFRGWQRQPMERTVQGELEKALSVVLGERVEVNGASRTDAGVHAYGQKASFQCDTDVPVGRLPVILNNSLSSGRILRERIPGDIRIVDASQREPGFHARFDAEGKTYVYKIRIAEQEDIFKRNYCYQMRHSLDLSAMDEAARRIEGTHDFKSFETSGGSERATTVRTISSLGIHRTGDDCESIVEIRVKGNGFLYNMVRIITGTLVEVGWGRREPESITHIIDSRDRGKAGHTAPASGLYLKEIYYLDTAKNDR